MQTSAPRSYRCVISYRPAPLCEADLSIVGIKATTPSQAERGVQAATDCAVVLDTYRQDRGAQ